MTKTQFDKWVMRMIERYKNERLFSDCESREVKDVVICVDRNHNVGIAKCHPDDKYNVNVGIAIAYARMRGIRVPKVITYKKLSEMKNGDRFYNKGGSEFTFIGKNKGKYVVWNYLNDKYVEWLTDDEYEVVD